MVRNAVYGNLKLIDWQDEFFRLAPIQNYQLSLSSGRGNTKYRVSMGYTDQEGIAIESNYKRLNFRANVESKVLNRITVGVNLAPSASWNEGGRVDGKDRQATNVLTMAPVAEPEDGIYTGAGAYGYYRWTSSSKISPVAYMEHVQNKGEKVQLSSSAYVKADIWNGIKAEVTGSYNFSSSQSRSFVPSTITKYRTDVEGYRTTASRTESRSNKFLLQGVCITQDIRQTYCRCHGRLFYGKLRRFLHEIISYSISGQLSGSDRYGRRRTHCCYSVIINSISPDVLLRTFTIRI